MVADGDPAETPANELDEAIGDDEYLERFVPSPYARNGVLRWQALKLTTRDKGGMSVGRLLVGVPALRRAGDQVIKKRVAAFAETVAGVMRGVSHEVLNTPGDFVGHAEIRPGGLDPGWPVPYEPEDPTEEALAMEAYYSALLKFFRYRSLEEA